MSNKSPSKNRSRSLIYNPISLVGIFIATISTAFGLPMMIIDIFNPHGNAYIAALVYLVLPGAAIFGVLVIVIGMLKERHARSKRSNAAISSIPLIDLNKPRHQMVLIGAITLFMVIVVLLSATGYRAYHFTDSVEFCGLVCHKVMKPEYTAYQHSPHARVSCAECHVGPGAGWFVRSKLSGLYQVYATLANKYTRPIASPVENLRPAQETCEQCHWPAKFFGAQQKTFKHSLADEENSPWHIKMLINVGGGDPDLGQTEGIHWHMNIKNDISYISTDDKREVIPWVRSVNEEGTVTEYMSTENPLSEEAFAKAVVRDMDCVDCHNRPSHVFNPPDRALEYAFEVGRLDRSLPFLKRESIRLLIGDYDTEEDALKLISDGIEYYYQTEYPEIYKDKSAEIREAILALQQIYSRNFFPEMKADWRAYPNQISHFNAEGCFRCHDGLHESENGRVISNNCNTCHTILAQGPPEKLIDAELKEQSFIHPVDLGMDVTEFKCSECHTGTSGL